MSYYSIEGKRLSKLAWVLISVIILIILVSGLFIIRKTFFSNTQADPNASAYSSVFLSNGQVYFGTISEVGDKYLVLKNIYYLQAVQALQGSTAQAQPFTLVKLGKELHGPTDTMYINQSQILFYENLRNDSSVVKSIEDYKGQ